MDKHGIVFKFGEVLVEPYIDINAAKYNYVVEHIVIKDKGGNGVGNLKYSSNGKFDNISTNFWSLAPIIGTEYNWNGIYCIDVHITDPKGACQQFHYSSQEKEDVISIIKRPFKILDKFAEFIDFKHYNAINENKQLKARILELEEKIKHFEENK